MLGVIPAAALAQGAEARMRVSVKVVEGSSVTTDQPMQVFFKKDALADLGALTLRGVDTEDVFIESEKSLKITDENGNELTVAVHEDRDMASQKNKRIVYRGEVEGELLSSSYTGQLETTIAYF